MPVQRVSPSTLLSPMEHLGRSYGLWSMVYGLLWPKQGSCFAKQQVSSWCRQARFCLLMVGGRGLDLFCPFFGLCLFSCLPIFILTSLRSLKCIYLIIPPAGSSRPRLSILHLFVFNHLLTVSRILLYLRHLLSRLSSHPGPSVKRRVRLCPWPASYTCPTDRT